MLFHRAITSILLASLAACASTPLGDENYTETKGEKLVALFTRYDHADNETGINQEALTVDLDLGYFLTDHHEVGVGVDGFLIRTELSESTNYFIGPFYNYIFKVSPRASIYAGPDILFQSFDSGADAIDEIGYGAHVGARFWYTPHVSFVLEPSYLFTDFEDSVGGAQDLFRFKFGVAIKF